MVAEVRHGSSEDDCGRHSCFEQGRIVAPRYRLIMEPLSALSGTLMSQLAFPMAGSRELLMPAVIQQRADSGSRSRGHEPDA